MTHESTIARSARDAAGTSWLRVMRAYLAIVLAANLIWELAQLPLYAIWREATVAEIAFAVVHCTVGDVLIAAACLVFALIVFGTSHWPSDRRVFRVVATASVAFGIAYTVYSEWLNVQVLETWQYAPAMPVLPPLRTGLAPLLQWIIIPPVAFWLSWRRRRTE